MTVAQIGTSAAGQTLVVDAQTGGSTGTAVSEDGIFVGTFNGRLYGDRAGLRSDRSQ